VQQIELTALSGLLSVLLRVQWSLARAGVADNGRFLRRSVRAPPPL
jgi:hypothetical protein